MNYVALDGWFFLNYACVDLESESGYVADTLLCRHKVPVRFKGDMVKEGEKYRVILCKIRRKYRAEFTPLLTDDGLLTGESETTVNLVTKKIEEME